MPVSFEGRHSQEKIIVTSVKEQVKQATNWNILLPHYVSYGTAVGTQGGCPALQAAAVVGMPSFFSSLKSITSPISTSTCEICKSTQRTDEKEFQVQRPASTAKGAPICHNHMPSFGALVRSKLKGEVPYSPHHSHRQKLNLHKNTAKPTTTNDHVYPAVMIFFKASIHCFSNEIKWLL